MTVVLIKNAIPKSLCRAAEANWPDQHWPFWHRYHGKTGNKFGSMDRHRIPSACIAALDALALSVADHIGDSFIDYDLHAAGMHMMPPKGFLSSHLDAETHPMRLWSRTHSIVLFVNSKWQGNWGGQLVIKTPEVTHSIFPEQGLAVVFETAKTWHEVKPLTDCEAVCCNPWRKTLALFAWEEKYNPDGRTSATFEGGLTSAS